MEKLFRIIEIDSVLAGQIASGPKEDHFHDFEELIVVSEGSLTHYIDFKADILKAPFVSYVSMGKMHRIEPENDIRGWVINYKSEFIPDSRLNFYSNFFTTTNLPLETDDCLKRFTGLCEIINSEFRLSGNDLTTIRHLVNALISMFDSEIRRNTPAGDDHKQPQVNAFSKFLALVEANFRTAESVSFYASAMNMSERNLNIICRNNIKMSVSEIIESRRLIEAKRMLMYSEKSVSEIGYELGYNEKSYFTRVFHSRMEITPTRYREMAKSIIS
jgi:AraC family transcriptional regulator, transcriptional activator of pobA